jgi:hypothetical protein
MRFDIEDGNGNPAAEKKANRNGFIHVPARGSIRVVMLCREAVRYRAHWMNSQKRYVPHMSENCVCTRNEIGATVRWCYGVYEEETRRIGLLELGASQAEIVTEAAERYESLRGLTFVLRKPDQTVRGRIECSLLGGGKLPDKDLPVCPDIRRQLLGLWEEVQAKKLIG